MERINKEEKTLIHISHLHPLKLIASPEPRPTCHACNMSCADQTYGCIDCRYFLHVCCATTRRSMDHPSHPAHALKFELTSPYLNGNYICNACGVDGTSFSLQCMECSFDLHLPCAVIPHKITYPSHRHPLFLVYENPYPSDITYADCDLCNKELDVEKWFYLCKSCDFGGHVGCFAPETLEVLSSGLRTPEALAPMPQQSELNGTTQVAEEMNNMLRLQKEMMQVQLQMKATRVMANIISNSISGSRI
ncbi:hypothetical protein LUZ62_075542 [Rhynchospora pubera]|uniref:DC1 domain-containing protein n=2 Tax=Rhynchospora pubera TaxID=906938 RepID=A0AAV8DFU2_9POAL|nr:hypothetical protein LUZ62_075542 [Rhynchospora pubera]